MNNINFKDLVTLDSTLEEIEVPEWVEYLTDQFIQPLAKQDFKLIGYTNQSVESAGSHILIFEGDDDLSKDFLDNLMDDDDGNPMSVYQTFFGTLWIFIPYCS